MEVKDIRRSGVLLDGNDGTRRTTNAIAIWLPVAGRDPGRVVRGRIGSGQVNAAVVCVERVDGDGGAGARGV